MIDYSNVKVGDTVWYSDVNRSGVTMTLVVKVGPKLVTTRGRLVFRKDTGCTNDAYGHQRLILDMELYEAEVRANKAFRRLMVGLSYSRNPGVTEADIVIAAKALKINL